MRVFDVCIQCAHVYMVCVIFFSSRDTAKYHEIRFNNNFSFWSLCLSFSFSLSFYCFVENIVFNFDRLLFVLFFEFISPNPRSPHCLSLFLPLKYARAGSLTIPFFFLFTYMKYNLIKYCCCFDYHFKRYWYFLAVYIDILLKRE